MSDSIMLLWWVSSLSCSGTDPNGNPLSSEAAPPNNAYSDQYGYGDYGHQAHGEYSDGTWKKLTLRNGRQLTCTAVDVLHKSVCTYDEICPLSLSRTSFDVSLALVMEMW